jgi:hypothetical protein
MPTLAEIRTRRVEHQRDFGVSPFIADMMIVREHKPKASITYAILLGYLRRSGPNGAFLADLCRTIAGNPDDSGVNAAASSLREMGLITFHERKRPGGYRMTINDEST